MGKTWVTCCVWVGNLWCVTRGAGEEGTVARGFGGIFAGEGVGFVWGGRFGLVAPISSAQLPAGINHKQYYFKLS